MGMGQVMDEAEGRPGPDPRADDPLWVQRAILCDLLIGRWMRKLAQRELSRTLETETLALGQAWPDGWQTCVDQGLEAAAGFERMGMLSERGQVLWGGRLSRHGYRPEDV